MAFNYIKLKENIQSNDLLVSGDTVVNSIQQTNEYLNQLCNLFTDLEFDLFEVLGQRNLSGVLGEIFSSFLCQNVEGFTVNPHPDGRPDILNLSNEEAANYFKNECFSLNNGRHLPLKNPLTPFKFKGVEVKCTVGSPKSGYKKQLEEDTGKKNFELGMSRIKYLSGFNYWAHHQHATDLLSLYYDYHPASNGTPQILAAFYANLLHDDWHEVSLGSETAKKTSNTSLNTGGKEKVYKGLVCIVDDKTYIEKFKQLGISINS